MPPAVGNGKIASILYRIADLLEIEGENPFKISAFRKAAQAVESWRRPVSEEADLRVIPGVGKGTAAVIQEILQTGESQVLKALQAKIPPDLLLLLKIPGLGPKSVGRLYRELGIDSIAKLEQAAREQRIRQLSGFGAKTELKIVKGIQQMKEKPERIPIAYVLPIAREIGRRIRQIPEVVQVEVAGSLRRYCETVKDLDFVIATEKPHNVAERLVDLPDVAEVLAQGDQKVSVIMEFLWPIQVDFRLVSPDRFASALLHFTGSQAHNVQLRQRAKTMGLKVNEYGIAETGSGGEAYERFGTEADLYARLKLPYIPPEVREGNGEIERVEKAGAAPPLIQLSDIRGDLHLHTDWSDGGNTIEEMALAAIERGYEYIAITDHSRSLRIANGLSIERLLQQKEAIKEVEKRLRKRHPHFTILCGVEMDILPDGSLDYPDEVLQEMDIVIASIHTGFRQDEAILTKRIIGAIENLHVDLIAHPTGRLIGRRAPYPVQIDSILAAARETGTAIELNANPNRLDLKPEYLQKAIEEYGVIISINTDAHSVVELENMEVGIGTARRGWVEARHVLNTWSLEKLRAYLKRND